MTPKMQRRAAARERAQAFRAMQTPTPSSNQISELQTVSATGTEIRSSDATIAVIDDTIPNASPVLKQPSAPEPEKPKKIGEGKVPTFSLRTMMCCGHADVSGIQAAYHGMTEYTDEQIFAGIEKSRRKNDADWQEMVNKCEALQKADKYAEAQNLQSEFIREHRLVKHPGCYILSFTAGNYERIYDRFTSFVNKHGLGKVDLSGPFHNPNSFNDVYTMLWCVDQQKWAAKTAEWF